MSHTDAPHPGLQCPICGARRFQEGACTGCRTVTGVRIPSNSVLGSYRIIDILGEGGMGIVYLAAHTRLDRRVALKVLRDEYVGNPHAQRRFFAEARAVNKIAHPNIIEITDFVEGDSNYYVMELLEGVSLAELISAGGLLALPRSIAIMTQLAEALAAVHRAGIVHRDLKPHNVLLVERAGRADFVKLVDFGIAKLAGVEDRDTSGPVFGTPRYMSPEQASGGAIDYRSDIYTFGVMLYEVVTGKAPFVGADFGELVVMHRTATPVPPRDIPDVPHEIPESLEALILACLAKSPLERPETIDRVASQLGAIADEQEAWRLEIGLQRRSVEREEVEPTRVLDIPALDPMDDLDPIIPPPTAESARPAAPPRPSRRPIVVAAALFAVAIAAIAIVLLVRDREPIAAPAETGVASKVQAELAITDQRMAAGRFVGTGGDEALDHLLVAKTLDATHTGVRDRLHAIARRFEGLAADALAAGSLEEAAAHLQTVLTAEPTNAAAATRMEEIEAKILARQRSRPTTK